MGSTLGMQPDSGTIKMIMKSDTLSRILSDMCRPGLLERGEDTALKEFVDSESRSYKGEKFNRFAAQVQARVKNLLQSTDSNEKLVGVIAVDELGETKSFGESMSRLSDLIRCLMEVFSPNTDMKTMQMASETLGRLVSHGGVGVSDVVDEQVQIGLQWLAGARQEYLRLAGVMVLQELAMAAPAIFNVHVRSFIEVIWNPLRDPKQNVREAAVSALRASLVLVEKRETRYRVQWYYRLFEETQRGLKKMISVETVHGSLLVLGELLGHTGEFMLARYREVCDTVLQFRDSKEKLIRRAVVSLIPKLAEFAPERFVRSYLRQSTQHLLSVIQSSSDKGAGFTAIAEMASSLSKADVAGHMKTPDNFLKPIAAQIQECLIAKSRGKGFCSEALDCAGVLCVSLREDWEPHMAELLEPAVATGLSPALVGALHRAVESLPSLLPKVQALLLDLLSLALTRRPFFAGASMNTIQVLQAALVQGEVQGSALTRLALQTLAGFSLVPHNLLDFARDFVMPYLEDSDPAIRRDAAIAISQTVQRHAYFGMTASASFTMAEKRDIDCIVHQLLATSVVDPATSVRRIVFDSLASSNSLDSHIAQPESLRALFIAFNDEASVVRSLAIRLAGHLLSVNPAYVGPSLRRHLIQLITDMESSPDSQQREQSAKLLCVLIRAAPRLVQPYTLAILKALLTKLQVVPGIKESMKPVHRNGKYVGSKSEANGTNAVGLSLALAEDGLHIAVLDTLGELSAVSGEELQHEVPAMLPLVIDALADASGSQTKRVVAARTLGRIVESTGAVVTPYFEYPQLLGILLRMLGEGSAASRREIVRTLGILGALDPHGHKLNLAELQGEGRLEREGVRPQYPGQEVVPPDPIGGLTVVDGVGYQDLLPSAGLATSSEDYYPTVAINALMRLLRDPSSASLHGKTVVALFRIVRSMGLGFVPYLPKVVPVLLSITRRTDDINRKIEMIRALGDLVILMRQHIRKFLPDLLNLVESFWDESPLLTPHILFLLSELAVTLRDDFRNHMAELLPKFVSLLGDAERTADYRLVSPALSALCALGPVLEDSLPLLLPSIFLILGARGGSEAPLAIKEEILSTLEALLPSMQLSAHSTAILHPLIRVMNSSSEELRIQALDVICAIALAIGPDFEVFIPIIRKSISKNKIPYHQAFSQIIARMSSNEPPCISEASDWEHSPGFLGVEHLGKKKALASEKSTLEQALAGVSLSDEYSDTKAGVHSEQGLRALKRGWESSQRSTREDWAEWMRNFSIELLKQSPSRALRACSSLAQANPAMARELFAAGFVSCWSELDEGMQEQLVRSLEAALASPTIPPDIVTTLLNLAEFMEHDEKALPLDTRTLGALAEKCHAYAKALHYKELEFQTTPHSAVEALISINNQLRQPDAAVGVLDLAQNKLSMELKESWYEKLQRWDDALKAYERKVESTKPGSQPHAEALLGQCRCLAALAEWETLFAVCRKEWSRVEPPARRSMAPVAAHAAWQLGDWDQMRNYVNFMSHSHSAGAEGAFLSAVLDLHEGDLESAAEATERARELLGADMSALVGESYERAYADMVRVQQLTELEEIVIVKAAERATKRNSDFACQVRDHTQSMWKGRLRGVQKNVEVWQAILSVRSLMIGMQEDVATWLKFSGLCRGVGRVKQSRKILETLLSAVKRDASRRKLSYLSPHNREMDVLYVLCKHMWSEGFKQEAFGNLQKLAVDLDEDKSLIFSDNLSEEEEDRMLLCARVHLKTGLWRRQMSEHISEGLISSTLASMRIATECAPNWAKAWHQWAYFNVETMIYYDANGESDLSRTFVAPAVEGFFRAIELSEVSEKEKPLEKRGVGSNLQDILRLLTLWFAYGDAEDVEAALRDGFGHVSIDTWLAVIPQIIARIHTNSPTVRDLIQSLLIMVGRQHPQALMYPLLVACKSQSPSRRAAATTVVEAVRQHSATLVEQAQLVGGELIRMAILWHEMWHEALEEASRLYFGESNVEGMLSTLLPLHEMMRKQGPTTLKEIAFVQAYGRELDEAHEWCLKYKASRKEAELHQAWDLYYHVFKRINKQLPSLTTLELQYVAPALVKAQNLELAVPGTYIVGEPLVTISSFAPQLTVITSKQRPRKLSIHGSDGAEYVFLLKGHEDLRQDERVMQLFGLVNSMLANDRETAERELTIARYAVIPLSPNSGLIGWVPNTDTLHALIREYRDARKIPLNVEHRLMLGMAPDFDHLTVIQKVEVFEHALESTSGEDLNRVLWLKSRSSEMWLDKRTNYTRSTAVMSMVGYILGLGDRHPSNLMLDRYSGKLLHIDFGDCFEASMHREKFPERVPFRLTRMMVKAMEVAGIEGNFRATCDEVMRVLRSNKDSVMAMLEAFVHDPLINWRLLNADNVGEATHGNEHGDPVDKAQVQEIEDIIEGAAASLPRREVTREQVLAAYGIQGDPSEVLNVRAVAVMRRMSDKLTGRDFLPEGFIGDSDSVTRQVRRLIQQATSHENLCQSYIGWCPWW